MALSTLLVGFGFSATTFHLPFLSSLNEYTVTGVVSSRPQNVADQLSDTPVYASLDEALDAASFDLVIITTPNHLHAEQARLALQHRCHVLVEKPFTLTVADAQALVALAEDAGTSLNVYQNRRFDDDFLTISALLEQQRLGEIKQLVSRFDRFRPTPRDRWRENAGPGSGILWDLGPHLVDQALQWFGVPDALYADVDILRDGGQSTDSFDITLYYPTHQVRLGSSPFQAAETLRFDVQGTAGSFRSMGMDPQENQLRSGMLPGHADFGKRPPGGFGQICNAQGCAPETFESGNYTGFYRQLAAAINQGKPGPAPAITVVDVINLLQMAEQSAMAGKKINVS
ncbi:Gfo/Idh/MocA family oxidoreductase [Alteromonas sp. ASW11-19]|uniref:Gfo/Idh/MocA family oxidoreductase n=1 Tax=Alteromonas salexigens TaxID=2982530 RepID=A0ABT2VKB0_9ALTE|nr:Gfo/Idh/MocA family oxidoreductase [Alteromonas salexigens]MCU7553449.1 Gfo/Idh/MocA family oxidoreductase [Alteromonas salexigens]